MISSFQVTYNIRLRYFKNHGMGAQWLSGRVLDSRPKGCGFEPHRRHCIVSLSKNINPSLVLVQPRKTHPFKTERLLMGRKESNQTKSRTMQCMYAHKKWHFGCSGYCLHFYQYQYFAASNYYNTRDRGAAGSSLIGVPALCP